MEEDTGSDIAVEVTATAKELWSSEDFLRKRQREQVEYISNLVNQDKFNSKRFFELLNSATGVLQKINDRLVEISLLNPKALKSYSSGCI